jgi:hypothetical protein
MATPFTYIASMDRVQKDISFNSFIGESITILQQKLQTVTGNVVYSICKLCCFKLSVLESEMAHICNLIDENISNNPLPTEFTYEIKQDNNFNNITLLLKITKNIEVPQEGEQPTEGEQPIEGEQPEGEQPIEDITTTIPEILYAE